MRGSATLRLSPLGMKRLRDLGHALGEAAAASAQAEPGRPGWQRVSVPIESIEHATGQMLRLGPEAEVIAPPALRDSVATTVGRIAALYAAPVSDRTRRPVRCARCAAVHAPRRTPP